MVNLFLILLIAAGLFAISNLIAAKAPNSKKFWDVVTPWSGVIGIALLVVSLIHLIKYVLPYLGTALSSFSGWMAIAAVVDGLLLGFLLGFSLISKLAGSKSPGAIAKAERFRLRLLTAQVPLGIAAIVLGIYLLV